MVVCNGRISVFTSVEDSVRAREDEEDDEMRRCISAMVVSSGAGRGVREDPSVEYGVGRGGSRS